MSQLACALVGLPRSLNHPADREVGADLFYHEHPARPEFHRPLAGTGKSAQEFLCFRVTGGESGGRKQ